MRIIRVEGALGLNKVRCGFSVVRPMVCRWLVTGWHSTEALELANNREEMPRRNTSQ
jgi:hypothetical protein